MRVGDQVKYTGNLKTYTGQSGEIVRVGAPGPQALCAVRFPNGAQIEVFQCNVVPELSLVPLELPKTLGEAVGIRKPALPIDSAERKRWPLFSGLLRYFPAALARVSHHSFLGNEKHNPGQRLNHARGKSGDHEDCIVRHLVDAAEHPAGSAARLEELSALAWRALALLQEECELAGHRPAPGATFDKEHNGTAIR